MKIQKGDAGYIQSRKKKILIKCLIEFGISIAIFVLGILQTKSRLNLLTLVAILGCLPASKALVEWIMILPHETIEKQHEQDIKACAQNMTTIFDAVFTSEKKIMPVESIVIQKHTICGYASKKKVPTNVIEEHLKKYMFANQITNISIKIFDNYDSYLKRVNELRGLESGEMDQDIRKILLNLSL